MSIDHHIEDMSVSELLSFLDSKRVNTDRLRQENSKLESAFESYKNSRTIKYTSNLMNDDVFPKEIEDLAKDEKDYYLGEFLKLESFDRESVEEVLPSRNNYNYEKIICYIMAEIIRREINPIKGLIVDISNEKNPDKDDLFELKEELLISKSKIDVLREILLTEEKKETIEKKNNLIFMPIALGEEVRIFDELKSIPQEEYAGFIELFKSIKDGTFKNIRRFTNNENYNGGLEVKGNGIRVVFQRLSKDTYCIITMFMKKTQIDYGYRNNLINRYSEYKSVEKELKQRVKDPLFINKHKEFENKLFEILSNGKINEGGCK